MDRTIRITGQGKLSLSPDTTVLRMSVHDKRAVYEEALALSDKYSESLKTALEKAGFERRDVKTESFNVSATYESYNDKDGNYKQRFAGYEFYHELKLKFPLDGERLSVALKALMYSEANPEFRIEYTVAEDTRAKANDSLLEEAVRDSRAKAELMCKTLGVELGELAGIDYSWGRLEMSVRPVSACFKAERAADMEFKLDIAPEDIEISDSVTVSWLIK